MSGTCSCNDLIKKLRWSVVSGLYRLVMHGIRASSLPLHLKHSLEFVLSDVQNRMFIIACVALRSLTLRVSHCNESRGTELEVWPNLSTEAHCCSLRRRKLLISDPATRPRTHGCFRCVSWVCSLSTSSSIRSLVQKHRIWLKIGNTCWTDTQTERQD